jgi:urease accessory protein
VSRAEAGAVSQEGVLSPHAGGDAAAALVLVRRLAPAAQGGTTGPASDASGSMLRLPLTADQRSSLRGHRRSACGRALVLQLPRGEALQPGDTLLSADGGVQVLVEAAPEPVMRVRSAETLALLQAAYHLGNRHVAMELHTDQLVLLQDSVLADLLRQRGLQVECCEAPFLPEAGAYAGHAHSHAHSHSHDHP